MRPFTYEQAADARAAVRMAAVQSDAHVRSPVQFIGGGTTLLDLMKLDVMRPDTLVDITPLEKADAGRIQQTPQAVRIGALVRMSDAAEHPLLARDFPMVAQSLALAASQQLRTMARLGGNVLQRTRCPYFREIAYGQCNKREPGSGCAALDGYNRLHAILGVSDACIASYPGDWAQALVALDTSVEVVGPRGPRVIPFAQLHKPPADTPHIETTLAPGELITAFTVPASAAAKRSLYLKVRDRESYAFALASAAVGLDLDGERVRDVRIGLGGVATVPWRARKAEEALRGQVLDEAAAEKAAEAEFAAARTHGHNDFKVPIGRQTLVRALMAAKAMEV